MRTIFENVIARGRYDLTGLLARIDRYHIEGKLSDEDREELYALARTGADTAAAVNVMDKLTEMEGRIAALEAICGVGSTAEYPDYIPGKWYSRGSQVTFDGCRYVCVAPESVVCVWSPADMPDYWQAQE